MQHTLVLILAVHAMAVILPGPDFAVITRLSIVGGRQTGLWAAAGVATSIAGYTLVTLLGLSLVLAALPGLSRILSVAGALYLMWLGIQSLRSQGTLPQAASLQAGRRQAWTTGFLTNLLNPKAMLYFGSILSQAISPGFTGWQLSLLFVLLVAETFLWFALVASLFSTPRMLHWLRAHLQGFERVIGVVLLALAARVGSLAWRG